ncbi:hypothetical protein pb186bvf_001627 [Paramecium bursaria]
MDQNNLEIERCLKQNHGQSKFLKFCKNENCQDRMLCLNCFKSGIHQNHQKYDPDLIVNISDINIELEGFMMKEKVYQEQLEQTQIQAKLIMENIQIMFESFITDIRDKQYQTIGNLHQCIYLQQMLLRNKLNQDKIQEILQIIDTDNKVNIDDLRQKIVSIQNIVRDKFELKQNVQEFVKSYKMQKSQHYMFGDIDIINNLPSFDEIRNSQYDYGSLNNEFDEINALDISQSLEYVAVAGKRNNKSYFLIFLLSDLRSKQYYYHDCKIFSLKFCPQSENLYFGDDQGYINAYGIDSEKIYLNIQINQDMIDCIFLVSHGQLLTVCSKEKSILLTDIYEYEKKSSHMVGHYAFQSHCNLAYSNLNLVYPNYTYLCVQNIFDQEPFIKKELNLKTQLPLQLEISKLGDQILTCQGQEIKHWLINNEEKILELQHRIDAKYNVMNISFVLNDQYIVYDNKGSIQIVFINQNDIITTIMLREQQQDRPYHLKQSFNINYICVVRNNKVIVLSNKRKI